MSDDFVKQQNVPLKIPVQPNRSLTCTRPSVRDPGQVIDCSCVFDEIPGKKKNHAS